MQKTWTAIAKNLWGATTKTRRMWNVGDTVLAEEKPNKHWVGEDEVDSVLKYDEVDAKTATKDDLLLMTKQQINDKFELGLEKHMILQTTKEALIKTVFDSQKLATIKTR